MGPQDAGYFEARQSPVRKGETGRAAEEHKVCQPSGKSQGMNFVPSPIQKSQ